jgi:hypothetical protein
VVGLRRICFTLPWKLRLGKASTLKRTGWSTRISADVGLGEGGVDLHLRQVLGDLEQRRRLEAGGDGLADIDLERSTTTPETGERITE